MTSLNHIYRNGFSLFVAVSLFELVLFTLEKTGVPRIYSIALSAVCGVVLWAYCVFKGSTTSPSKFFFADNSARSTINALAMTACVGFPLILSEGGGLYFSNPTLLVVLIIGISLGLAGSGLLISRHFQNTGAGDITQFLIESYASSVIGRTIAAIVMGAAILLSLCGLAAAAQTTSWFFNISLFASTITCGVAIMATGMLGGASSNLRLAAIAATLIIVSLTLPLVYHSISTVGFPIGQITFGRGALSDNWELEAQLTSLGIPTLGEVLMPASPLLSLSGGQAVCAGLVIAAGVTFYPALVQQYNVTPSQDFASRSAGKAIVFSAFAGLSLIALLSYTQFEFYELSLGLPVSEARLSVPFMYSWGSRAIDLVTFCGQALENDRQLLSACIDKADHVISVQDFTLNGALVLAASPDIAALPFSFTALLSSSIILLMISFSSTVLLSGANNLSSAIYAKQPEKVASARIFLNRFIILVGGGGVMALAYNRHFDSVSIFVLTMSILASTIAPAMIASLRLTKLNSVWCLSAIAAGFAVSVLYFVLAKYGVDLIAGTNDEIRIILPGMDSPVIPELSAIYALPLALFILFIGILSGDFSTSGKSGAPFERG